LYYNNFTETTVESIEMKIAQCSDMHLEFGSYAFTDVDADVLILGGDILLASDFEPLNLFQIPKSKRFHEFLKNVSSKFKDVIYIMGNHEHYHTDFATSAQHIRKCMAEYKNIHFLDNESVSIDGVTFIGGTMWTNMNSRNPITIQRMKNNLNDFSVIQNSNVMTSKKVPIYEEDDRGIKIQSSYKYVKEPSYFSPDDAADEFYKFVDYLTDMIEGKSDETFVVCTHHAPSRLSTKQRYLDDFHMNGGYSSSLEEFILDHPQIKVWTHGHTHDKFDYLIGTTRIICNPRGYANHEASADDFEPLIFEV
jgi:Icc-related predicted phosphoesterase